MRVGTPFYSQKSFKQREHGRTATKCRVDTDLIENMLEFHFLKRNWQRSRISQHGDTRRPGGFVPSPPITAGHGHGKK